MAVGSIKRYLNVPELADYIDSTDGSVRQLVHQRRIPYLRVAGGRRILFDLLAIDRWLLEQSVEPLEEGEK
jgi:excisionase family DNA binding protein